jgi:hypothetical protein
MFAVIKTPEYSTMKKLLFALSAFALLATACKKDDDNTAEVTKENIAGAYKLESLKMKIGSAPETDITNQVDACQRDDIQTFLVNETYNYTDAGTLCSPPGDDSGTWSLPSTTSMIIDGDLYTINKFDGSSLELSYSEVVNGTTYVATTTLKKQ